MDKNDPTFIALHNKDRKTKNKMYRKAFENMIHNIDRMDKNSKQDYQEMITKMVQQNIRDDELSKLVESLQEIGYAEPEQIMTLFKHK